MTSMRKCSIYVWSWRIDVRRVANRQPFVGLFARVVRSNAVLSSRFWECGRGSLGRGGGIVNVVRVGRAVW